MSALVTLSVRRAGWVVLAWLAVIIGLNVAVPQPAPSAAPPAVRWPARAEEGERAR